MDTKPIMSRVPIFVTDVIEGKAQNKKWSLSFTVADILTEVVINKQIPAYLLEQ